MSNQDSSQLQKTKKYTIILNLLEYLSFMINTIKDNITKFIQSFENTKCKTTHTEIKQKIDDLIPLLNNVNIFITESKKKVNDKINLINNSNNNIKQQMFMKTINEDVDFIMSLFYNEQTNTNNLLPVFNLFDKINNLFDKIIQTNDDGILCLLQTTYININTSNITETLNLDTINSELSTNFTNMCMDANKKNYNGLNSEAIIIQKIVIFLLSAPILLFMSFSNIQIVALDYIFELINKMLLTIKKSLLLFVKVTNYIDRKHCNMSNANNNNELTKRSYNLYNFFIYSHKYFIQYANAINNLKVKTLNISKPDDNDALIINLVKNSNINPDELKVIDTANLSVGGFNLFNQS